MAFPESTLWAPNHTTMVFDVEALPELVHDTVKWMRKLRKRLGFNTIAVSGHSGLILGALVASKLKMPLLAVRKPDDKALDSRKVNGTRLKDCRYIVLDDLVDSGTTLRRIIREIDHMAKEEDRRWADWAAGTIDALKGNPMRSPQCVGALLFNSMNRDEPRTEWSFSINQRISLFHLPYLTRHGGLL